MVGGLYSLRLRAPHVVSVVHPKLANPVARDSQRHLMSSRPYEALRSRASESNDGGDGDSTSEQQPPRDTGPGAIGAGNDTSEPGPMARRLEEATEEALLSGGRAGRRAVEDAGFSEELKERLLTKVKDAQFRSEHAAAFAKSGLSSSTGKATGIDSGSGSGTGIGGQVWTGEESTEDALLRMLDDAHKPLKPGLRGSTKPKYPDLQPIDMRMWPVDRSSPGQRASNARDKAATYTGLGLGSKEKSGQGLGDNEREALRQEFRDRFKPAARGIPNTLAGIASLANERIEDAIARGQFKNIPRGRGVERDPRSDNPFIDTTEYVMNKMIKRQDITPPWIEKQQELAKAVHVFRTRLRSDWKRHAARMIASKGGSLQEQIDRARQYALAERVHNPQKHSTEQVIPTNYTEDPVMVTLRQQLVDDQALELVPDTVAATNSPTSAGDDRPNRFPDDVVSNEHTPLSLPFRDPQWIQTETSYMQLSITNLNSLTRSYNLMAPELAKKPYFTLERELKTCYAEVAPQLPDIIRQRATLSSKGQTEARNQSSGIFDHFRNGSSKSSQIFIHESKAPRYGLREFWRDLFSWNWNKT